MIESTVIEYYIQKSRLCVCCKPTASHTSRFIIPRVKCGGGSIILWRCFFSAETRHLVRIEGGTDGECSEILQENLLKSAKKWSLGGNITLSRAIIWSTCPKRYCKCPTVPQSKTWSQFHWESVALFENWSPQAVFGLVSSMLNMWTKVNYSGKSMWTLDHHSHVGFPKKATKKLEFSEMPLSAVALRFPWTQPCPLE